MIKLLSFQHKSIFQLACLLEIHGLAESRVPRPSRWGCGALRHRWGSPARTLARASPHSFPTPAGSLGLALMLRKKKPAEGSRAGLSPNTRFPAARLCPGISTLVACDVFLRPTPRSRGHNKSLTCLLPSPHLHGKAEAPCSQLQGKARLTFLTLQQMLSQPRLSECQSRHQSFTVC